jgi:hypothetical protein
MKLLILQRNLVSRTWRVGRKCAIKKSLSLCVLLEHPIPISIQADGQAHPNTPKRKRERECTQTDSKKEGKEGRKKERIWWMFLSVSLCLSVRAAVLCEIGNDPI